MATQVVFRGVLNGAPLHRLETKTMILDLHGFGNQLAEGTLMTIKLSLAAVSAGLLLGLLGAVAKTSRYGALRALGTLYTTVVRGVPETLWVLMVYFGTVSGLNAIGSLFGYPDLALSPFAAGTCALALCFGAYATEVLRGALLAIPKGHREAGQTLGLSSFRIFWRIILPQVWRIALPGLGNLYLVLLKDTALVSLISLDEIMRKASIASNATKEPFTFYLTAALIYLSLTVVAMTIMHLAEKRVSQGFTRNEL